jgi:hypothetical protein
LSKGLATKIAWAFTAGIGFKFAASGFLLHDAPEK